MQKEPEMTMTDSQDSLKRRLLPFLAQKQEYSDPAILIAGPCSAESEHQLLSAAQGLAESGIRILRAGLWKPRTRPGCFEGVGAEGLPWMAKAKEITGMLTATEVACGEHVRLAIDGGIDILWIGARTTGNPFAVEEIAHALDRAGALSTPVMVKNPLSPDLDLWIGAMLRLLNGGVRHLAAVHRGFTGYVSHMGYRNAPMWQTPIELRNRWPELPLLCDPSHIGGSRELLQPIAQQALDMGFDGLVMESHPDPDKALSDASQQVTPENLKCILDSLSFRKGCVCGNDLESYRSEIDTIDAELISLLARRMEVSREIGRYKRNHGIPVIQPSRFSTVIESRLGSATSHGMSSDFMRSVLEAVHAESVRQQITEK